VIIKKDKDIIQNYFEDNSGVRGANADFVAVAESQDDISVFLAQMSKSNTPVTIAGALTGNTASGLAFGGAILSLEKLNKIGEVEKIDHKNAIITVQSGAKTNDIKLKAYKEGWMYPPDPTEKNASIGGNISTNASGGRGFKFGSTRDYVEALEVVFSDGSCSFIKRGEYFASSGGTIVFDTDKGKKSVSLPKYHLPFVKNAAGYYNYSNADLIDVLIGSEGTLCVICKAVLKLVPCFKEVFGGIIFFERRNDAYEFVNKIKLLSKKAKEENLRDSIGAMSLEYFDANALSVIRDDYPTIPKNVEAGIMFEQDVYDGDNQDILTEKWVEVIERDNIDLEKVWFAQSMEELEKFRIFRHKIPERVNEMVRRNKFPKVGTDFAVPCGALLEIVDFCDVKFKKAGIFNLTFGHIGDNHLHANILPTSAQEYEKCRQIYASIASKAVELCGTVSAEHGIGKLKHIFLEKMLGENGFKEMSKFKKSFDGAGILGQDNIFPKKYLNS
jgi:D-lactate dehydrogenase (cytochrome)